MSKPRANKNIIKRLLSFALATVLSISSLSVISAPLEVHAWDANAGGGGTSNTGSTDHGGASRHFWGYRIYVIDEYGVTLSPVVDVVSQTPNANEWYGSTRFGGQVSGAPKEPMKGMPAPFTSGSNDKGFVGKGQALKQWLKTKTGNGEEEKIDELIMTYFGYEVWNLFRDQTSKKWLAIEPITWHNLYRGADDLSQTSKRIYGTANNWLQAYSENKISGGTYTSSLDNRVLQSCLVLERDQPELGLVKPHSGVPVYSNGNEGWGLQLYSNDGLGGYHTWDSKNYTGATYKPAKSPDPNEAKKDLRRMLAETHQNSAVILRYLVHLGDVVKDLKPSQTVSHTAQTEDAQRPNYVGNNNAAFSVGIIAPIPSFSDMQLAKCAKAGYSIQDLAILSGYNTAYIYDHVRAYFQKYPNKR